MKHFKTEKEANDYRKFNRPHHQVVKGLSLIENKPFTVVETPKINFNHPPFGDSPNKSL